MDQNVQAKKVYGDPGDELVREKLLHHFAEQSERLRQMFPNPYFARCDVQFDEGEQKTMYFSKFSLPDESVFSWTTPAARLRFADIGPTTYETSDGEHNSGELRRKDQFMIVDGKIVFMTSESGHYGRTLVHQETLSQKKAGFILPEIVERMERAQDDIIRAESDEPFLIAGPAGSGKTTLAFHRLAYLLQSPDTAEQFTSDNVIVFVQDEGTRAYFSQLLPDLGLHDVNVTTFDVWARGLLGLEDYTYMRRPNSVDAKDDFYEFDKAGAIKHADWEQSRSPFDALKLLYQNHCSKEHAMRFEKQLSERELDRFDLTWLLKREAETKGLFVEQEYLEVKKNFEVKRKKRSVPVEYSLIVVDEAQNYLPTQLTVLRRCLSKKTQAMLYIGDLGQQVQIGTLQKWSDIGEVIASERRVELEKVYRNTKPIIAYIQSKGFDVSIPEGLRDGKPVVAEICPGQEAQHKRISQILESSDTAAQVGVLSPDPQTISSIKQSFENTSRLHAMTVHEAQGVEFDIVILLGFTDQFFQTSHDEPIASELQKIKKDLYYVALTRATEELIVLEG